MVVEQKICLKCKKEKDLSYYSKNKAKKDGLNIYCRDCISEQNKKRYLENPGQAKELAKLYRKEHKNDPIFNKRKKRNQEKWLKSKAYYEYTKKYRAEHREERNKAKREYTKRVRKENPAQLLLEYTKRRARERNMQHNLVIEDILVPAKCPILDIPLFPRCL